MNSHIVSLYRTYLRQTRALPHIYLRQFFRIKGRDDFGSVLDTKSAELRRGKLKRVSRDLRRLQAANSGKPDAFDRILDIAYGRVGKLRRELLEPLLLDPNVLHRSADSRNDKTCLPSYSPELAALLTSGISRTTKPLQKQHLAFPPGLPERAKPNSKDAKLLGPLSRRREYNVRWRFFKNEASKVLPPLQGPIHPGTNHTDINTPSHLLNYGFQNSRILEELLSLAGSPSSTPGLTCEKNRISQTPDANPFDGNLPVRWLRRRYQLLLARIPLLISKKPPKNNTTSAYDVLLADNAIPVSRLHPMRLRAVDAADVPWISDITVQPDKKQQSTYIQPSQERH